MRNSNDGVSRDSGKPNIPASAGDELSELKETNTALLEHLTKLLSANAKLVGVEQRSVAQEALLLKNQERENEFKNRIKALEREAAAGARFMESASARIRSLETSLEDKAAESLSALTRIENFEKQARDCELRRQALESQVRELESAKADKSNRGLELERKLNAAEARLKEDYRKLALLSDAGWEKDLQIKSLQAEVNEFKSRLSAQATTLETQENENRELREVVARCQVDPIDASELVRLNGEVANLQKRLAKAEAFARSTAIGLQKERETSATCGAENARLQKECTEMERQLSKVMADADVARLRMLRERDEYSRKAFARETEIVTALKAEIATARSQIASLEYRLADAKRETEAQAASFKHESEELNRKARERESEVAARLRIEISQLEEQCEDLESALEDAKRDADLARNASLKEKEDGIKKVAERESELQKQWAIEIQRREQRESELERRGCERDAEWQRQLAAESSRRDARESELREVLAKQKTEFSALENQLRAQSSAAQTELSLLQAKQVTLTENLQSTRIERDEAEEEISRLEETIENLKTALFAKQSEAQQIREQAFTQACERERALKVEIRDAEARLEVSEKRAQELDVRAQKLDAELRVSREAKETAAREIGRLQAALIKKDALHQGANSAFADREAQLRLRENQLRASVNSCNKDKVELRTVGKSLVQEMRLLATTHPLKDYLAATEFELSKLEIQLKTTPTLSADRARLEEYLSKLVEQRDFLKSVLSNSQRQFEGRAAALERLISGASFAPVPVQPIPEPRPTSTVEAGPRWERPNEEFR